MLRLAPFLTIGFLVGPVLAGLVFVAAPSLGWAPFLGETEIGLWPFFKFFAEPGIGQSIWIGLWTGLAASFFAFLLASLLVAGFAGTRTFNFLSGLMKPVIALPHAAAAIGLAFLVAPSGFLLRLISPELTGFTRPPDWIILNDPAGMALMAGLVLKEMPFLLLVMIAALPQTDMRQVKVARGLGRGQVWSFLTSVFPGIYRQIRYPLYAVIAFSTSVVDMALILGPGTPPSLAIRVLRLMNDPDLSQRLTAAAGALVQLGVSLFAVFVWWMAEKLIARLGKAIALSGVHLRHDAAARLVVALLVGLMAVLVLLGASLLALWSVSGFWRFPDAWPQNFTLSEWVKEAGQWSDLVFNTGLVGLAASLLAVGLILLCLEYEYRKDIRLSPLSRLVLYLPLLVPQIAFLAGLSVWLLWLGLDGNLFAVILAHLIFVLPYAYLLLGDAFHAVDRRYLATARLFGRSEANVFLTIRLPILLKPILTALAMCFAISVAQYLPTLMIGGGRVPTVTTEAVALMSGGNRRLIGIYALLQALLPFIALMLASAIPAIQWRNRKGLRGGVT